MQRRSFLDQPSSKGKHKITDHQLKLDLSNRKLTDTGCQVVINTLLQCLQHRDETHPEGIVQIVHLIKISLKGNDLTAESLPKLAQVISLSTGYLEDLDLSDNQIEISNENEKENWRQFLGSFRNCFMLKRLNFGGNPLSTLAIEILAKTYIESPLYVGTDGGNDWSIYSPGSVRDRVHEKQMASQTGEMHESGKIKLAMEREHFRRQHGLRSVPYFILSNLELTRAAIVHLSSMVSAQMSRAYLRTFLPDTKPVVLTDEAARNCHSIIWLPNQSFDSRSRELLHCATAMVTLPPAMLQGNIRTLQTPRARSKSLVPKMRPHGAHGHLLKTVLSTALQEEGPGASDLWMTSCKMLKLRTLLLNEPSQVVSENSQT
ncbi:hypothetical protein N7492_009074 [Penicillium capsulatum]|uniref:Uncharacterized protein n=1 Tax=Penicillium capsulatum TaxID=69766 RepID=A0A9W9HRU9_9EURO|nr:hypothetical protein N7492_009074 [Penicillium capsulatum]KAJ6106473.1 hypothetical protein N7512_009990 [Penicillium capsulatum]